MPMHWMLRWNAGRFIDTNTGRYDNDYTAYRYIPSGDGMAQRRRCDS